MKLISNNDHLADFYNQLDLVKTISIDTEFVRSTTYFAKLSLIQIKFNDQTVIIDAQSTNIDLNLFYTKILSNSKFLKVIHSGRQDLEIFYQLFGGLPVNVFDTQIAAKVCGIGSMLSYRDLCYIICQVDIDKSFQHSNWAQRPLRPELLEYAALDVEYLPIIHRYLTSELERQNIYETYNSAVLSNLLNPEIYKINYNEAWKKLKLPRTTKIIFDRLKILAAFREEQAFLWDKPRRHILSDNDLLKIANHLPTSRLNLQKLNLENKFQLNKIENLLIDLCHGIQEAKP